MAGLKLIIGFVIVLVFLYFIFTNQAFMSYVNSMLSNSGIPGGKASSGALSQLVNETQGMNETSFLAWAQNQANTNPLILGIKQASNATTLTPHLKSVWSELQIVRAEGSKGLSSLIGIIDSIMNGTS